LINIKNNEYKTILKSCSEKINAKNNTEKDNIKDFDSTFDSQTNLEKNNSENLSVSNNSNTIIYEKQDNKNIEFNYPKNENEIRLNYYSKLINNGI